MWYLKNCSVAALFTLGMIITVLKGKGCECDVRHMDMPLWNKVAGAVHKIHDLFKAVTKLFREPHSDPPLLEDLIVTV